MFAPEGYIRWVDLFEEIKSWSYRIILAEQLQNESQDTGVAFDEKVYPMGSLIRRIHQSFMAETPELFLSGVKINERKEFAKANEELHFESDLISNIIMANVLLEFDTLVCSPMGDILRAPELMLLHSDRLDWCHWCWPVRETPEFLSYFEQFDKGNFSGQELANRYCFIDSFSGVIELKNNSIINFGAASHFGRPTSKADKSKHLITKFVSQAIEPFIGWAVVWNSANLPKSTMELLQGIGMLDESWSIPMQADGKSFPEIGKRKRGPKPTGARNEFYRRYPGGKPSELSADAIAAELTEAGFSITGRMISYYESERNNS